jgi:hypothetical protein
MSNAKGKPSSIGTVLTFLKKGTCSQTSCEVLNRAFDQPLAEEELATAPLAGGLMMHGYQCGLIWGATLAAGAQAYRQLGGGAESETRAVLAAQRLIQTFRAGNHQQMNCLEITEIGRSSTTLQMITKFLIKGGAIGCFRRAARYASAAFDEVNTTLSERQVEVPPAPVSCSSMLARKLGSSDLHATMAAGLAGGIGLTGGACGALGAAVWLGTLGDLRTNGGKVTFSNPRAAATIDRFLKCTGYEFECSKIVGRTFENVGDHAGFVCSGGCSKILEALADSGPTG